MTWMTPPVKLVLFETVEFWSRPEKKVTLVPPKASTRCPPVTFAKAPGCREVRTKEVFVKLLYVPLRMWYLVQS